MDTRFDDLVRELEGRNWMGGEFHQRHDHEGHVALLFGRLGEVQIGVMPVPEIPACTTRHKVVVPDPRRPGQRVLRTITQQHAFVAGVGFELRCDTPEKHLRHHADTAAAAVDMMEKWRQDMTPEHQQFLGVVRRRTK